MYKSKIRKVKRTKKSRRKSTNIRRRRSKQRGGVDYEFRLGGVFLEYDNPNPRLIMLIKIKPYKTFTGEIREWYPFYVSSGKYTGGGTGNLQPFSGIISIKSQNLSGGLGSRLINYFGENIPEFKTKLDEWSEPLSLDQYENLNLSLMYSGAHFLKCERFTKLSMFKEYLETIQPKLITSKYMTLTAKMKETISRFRQQTENFKICTREFMDINRTFKDKFTLNKNSETQYIVTFNSDIYPLPIFELKDINSFIDDNNPLGIKIDDALGAFINRQTHSDLNTFVQQFKRSDAEVIDIIEASPRLKTLSLKMEIPILAEIHKINSYIDMIDEGILPNMRDILYYIASME